MKQFYLLIILSLMITFSHAQWTRVAALPATDIVAFGTQNSTLYAASDSNFVYKTDDGINWDRINISSSRALINTIGFFNGEIFVGTMRSGVLSSADGGSSWQRGAG